MHQAHFQSKCSYVGSVVDVITEFRMHIGHFIFRRSCLVRYPLKCEGGSPLIIWRLEGWRCHCLLE
jgi:hypothetical protein